MNGAAPPGRPVFLDGSGRRRRWMTIGGAGLGVGLLAILVLFVLGLSGGSALHVPGFPDLNAPAAGAVPSPTPSTHSSGASPVQPGSAGQSTLAPPTSDPSADPSLRRHVPTQTPSRDPRPTRT
jgi:hypothetical protein